MNYPEFNLEHALEGMPITVQCEGFVVERGYIYQSLCCPDKFIIEVNEGALTVGKLSMTKDNLFFVNGETIKVLGMWKETITFDHWDAVDPKYNFIARDSDGARWAYTHRPVAEGSMWVMVEGDYTSASALNLPQAFYECDWKDSLIERPKGE